MEDPCLRPCSPRHLVGLACPTHWPFLVTWKSLGKIPTQITKSPSFRIPPQEVSATEDFSIKMAQRGADSRVPQQSAGLTCTKPQVLTTTL